MIGAAVRTVAEQFGNRKCLAAIGGDNSLVSKQRRRHRGGMRRDAGAEIEGDAVEMIARSSRAIAAALLQAGNVRIAKVPAARTLREIAAEGGEVTDLRRGKTERSRRN